MRNEISKCKSTESPTDNNPPPACQLTGYSSWSNQGDIYLTYLQEYFKPVKTTSCYVMCLTYFTDVYVSRLLPILQTKTTSCMLVDFIWSRYKEPKKCSLIKPKLQQAKRKASKRTERKNITGCYINMITMEWRKYWAVLAPIEKCW